MKPHLLPKTGQKLVFLRKKKVIFFYETVKNCDLWSTKLWNWKKFRNEKQFRNISNCALYMAYMSRKLRPRFWWRQKLSMKLSIRSRLLGKNRPKNPSFIKMKLEKLVLTIFQNPHSRNLYFSSRNIYEVPICNKNLYFYYETTIKSVLCFLLVLTAKHNSSIDYLIFCSCQRFTSRY